MGFSSLLTTWLNPKPIKRHALRSSGQRYDPIDAKLYGCADEVDFS